MMDDHTDCVLCKIAAHEAAAQVLYEDNEIMAVLDLYPATRGHILVISKKHIANIYEMPDGTGKRIMECALRLCKAIRKGLRPDGLNLIQANGEAGGQTIDHFHLHIVPRYDDDKVVLKFGHGNQPADEKALGDTAAAIRLEL